MHVDLTQGPGACTFEETNREFNCLRSTHQRSSPATRDNRNRHHNKLLNHYNTPVRSKSCFQDNNQAGQHTPLGQQPQRNQGALQGTVLRGYRTSYVGGANKWVTCGRSIGIMQRTDHQRSRVAGTLRSA